MESDIGVTIVNNLLSQKAVTNVVTMDEDASVIKNMKDKTFDGDKISKASDPNHLKKIFIKDLEKLKKDKSLPFHTQHGILTFKQRITFGNYFLKCIQKHHKNPEDLKLAFQRMISHIWGKHGECGDWCKNKKIWIQKLWNNI